MPIEITPGITITAGLVIGAGDAPIQTATLLITEGGLDLQTEVGDNLTTE